MGFNSAFKGLNTGTALNLHRSIFQTPICPSSPSSKAVISDFNGCCNTNVREAYCREILQGSTKQNIQENVHEIFEDRVHENLRTFGLGS